MSLIIVIREVLGFMLEWNATNLLRQLLMNHLLFGGILLGRS
jgi:hypothetical protein